MRHRRTVGHHKQTKPNTEGTECTESGRRRRDLLPDQARRSASSFVTEGDHGIDARGASRREVTGREGCEEKQEADGAGR